MTRITANMRAALEFALHTGELRRLVDDRSKDQRKRTIKGTDKPNPAYVEPPEWPHGLAAATLAALVRHGWLEQGIRKNRKGYDMHVWTITDAGRQALVDDATPRARQGGQQRVSTGKTLVDYEMQIVTQRDGSRRLQRVPVERPDRLSDRTGLEAQARWEEAQDRRAQARRLTKLLRAA